MAPNPKQEGRTCALILFNNKGLELTKRGGNDRRPGHWANSSESYYGLA